MLRAGSCSALSGLVRRLAIRGLSAVVLHHRKNVRILKASGAHPLMSTSLVHLSRVRLLVGPSTRGQDQSSSILHIQQQLQNGAKLIPTSNHRRREPPQPSTFHHRRVSSTFPPVLDVAFSLRLLRDKVGDASTLRQYPQVCLSSCIPSHPILSSPGIVSLRTYLRHAQTPRTP